MTSSYLRAPFPWVTKCQIEGEEHSLMLPIKLNSTLYIGDASRPRAGPGDPRDKREVFLDSDAGQKLGQCTQTGRGARAGRAFSCGSNWIAHCTCRSGDADHPRAQQRDMQDKHAVFAC